MIGKALSHYKILEELGRGGMGIVYKAEDTKLDRTVAIKVLPSAALASEDDRARFYREAKAAAQLHHPHIASVFEIDEAVPEGSKDDDLRPFISMEFIEGETLHDRIQKGPLKLEEAVRIASQIASGLEAAHEKDIVHRDLKSQNVMLTKKGEAKILDFGLAQTAASTKLTRMGSTLGTVAYMSPEQARGEPVDLRTDLWSLGVVLYEMISGKSPFPGDYEQAVVYEILNQTPEPLTAVRTGVPMQLEWLVNKLLAKSADHRCQTATDFLVDLKAIDVKAERYSSADPISSSRSLRPVAETVPVHSIKVNRPTLLIGGLVVALLGAFLGYSFKSGSELKDDDIVLHTNIVLPANEPVALIGSAPFFVGQRAITLSSDGHLLAYAAELSSGATQLAVRDLDGYESKLIPGTEGAFFPFFSPDGSELGFFANNHLNVVPLSGGASRVLVDVRNPLGGVWTTHDEIIYSDHEGNRLRKIPVRIGEAENISTGPLSQPALLPDGENLLVTLVSDLSIISISTGIVTPLELGTRANPATSSSYTDSGHILFMQNAQLMAVSFDAERLRLTGQAIPVIEDVRNESLHEGGQYAISKNGTLIYAPGGDVRVGHLVVATGQDEIEVLPFESQIFGEMRLSPDGARLAICVLGARWDIWIYDIDRLDSPQRLTFEENNFNPVWTPDGERIFFRSDRNGSWDIYSSSASSSGDVIQLTTNTIVQFPSSISNDGKRLLITQPDPDTRMDILTLSLESDSTFEKTISSVYMEWTGTFSPDGKSIAYVSDEAGIYDIYVKAFSGGSERTRLSNGGGMDPIWSEDGKTIYYNYVRDIYSVDIDPANNYSHGVPKLLFSGDFIELAGYNWAYDESHDRFFFVQTIESETVAKELNVISNWFEELKRLAPPSE